MQQTVTIIDNEKKQTQPYAAWIGLDWADQKHFWSMRTAEGKLQRGELDNTPEAIEIWASTLEQRFAGQPVALAIEQARGAVISMLSKYAHLVLFPVHSTAVANYRKTFTPSGAKSDSRDGDLILDLLIKHPERLQRLLPDTVETRKLQFLTEERRKLVNLHTSQLQYLINWLKQVFPQILDWFEHPSSPLVEDLLVRWPTLPQLQKATPKTLLKFLQRHNCRSEERNQQRLAEFRQAVAATHDPALLSAGVLCIQNAVRLLAQMRAGIAAFDLQIAEVFKSHPDRAIVESLPGAGPVLEPRLIAAVGTHRDRFASANALASFTGIAPVTEASGNSRWVHWRWACPKFIRQTFHEWAGCSIRTCDWARAYYDKKRAEGKGHHAAVRALAFKWIRIFFRCWRDRVPYDEQRYLASVRARLPKNAPTPPATTKPTLVLKTCGDFKKIVEVSY
jgi:transposase